MTSRISARAVLAVAALLLWPAGLAASPEGDETAGFLPKDDLGVSAFLAANPESDGRGVLVAVLDTGVDLLHPALQRTSDGLVKVMDFHDATDAGDVDTTVAAKVEEGTVLGISGRRLRLGDSPPAEVRLGLVRAGEIYPRGLLRRLRKKRKEKRAEQIRLAADRTAGGKAPPHPADPGDPVHDLLLYRVDDGWRVVVDSDGDGDLAEERTLREFAVAQEVGLLGVETRLGFGVRVKREGKVVSLLFDGGSHGTHVAGIIAGYHAPGSPLNGLAPGARILAVKIGNGRYGGPTTHLALIRGLEWAGRKGASVVNISFGGPSLYGDGREESARFIDKAVEKYGYAVCLSAGNNGPAHTTVGSPACARRAISIGAWCSAATQTSNYGVVHPRGDSLFGFSSRGPLPSGGAGVDFIAPGAAVSTMPEWTLVGGSNMNGTSMAAPQASGAIAVLLSAARREKLVTSPNHLIYALRTGAKPVPGLTQLEQGYGLLQVGPALQALRALAEDAMPIEWKVRTDLPATRGTGFYERACLDDTPLEFDLSIEPDFGRKVPAECRARFSRVLRLVPDAEWLGVASPVHASSRGATIRAVADPTRMKPGLNVGTIRVVDIETGREEARLMATVVRPRVVWCGSWLRETVKLVPGEARSIFVRVPPGATQVRLEARETATEGDSRIAFGTVDPRTGASTAPEGADRDLVPGGVTVLHRGVREATTLEIVLSRPFRTAPEESVVEVGACFKGLSSNVSEVTIPHGRRGTHLNLRAGGDVGGRFEAFVDWEVRPLALAWKSVKDPDGPALLGEETVFEHEGVATFDVPSNRPELRFEVRYEKPYEDYLDDAIYLIRDMNGRVRAKGLLRFGSFSFKAPHRGRFELVLRNWERGRRFHDGGRIFSPLLLTKVRRQNLAVRHDIYEGIVPGGPSGGRFRLPDGSLSSAFVLRPKGDGAMRGTLRFKDGDWGAALLERRLRVEPSAPRSARDAVAGELKALLSREVRAALDRDAVEEEAFKRLEGTAEAARALGVLEPRESAGLETLRGRRGPEPAKVALERLDALVAATKKKGGENHQAALRARLETALNCGDLEKAKGDLGQLRGDGEDAHRARFLHARAVKDSKAALGHLDKLLKTAPPTPALYRARFELLVANGRKDQARRLLLSWTEHFPGRTADRTGMAALLEADAKPK